MNQCDDNLEHDPDDMHSTCMQKDPVVSIRLFDRNFMLCSALRIFTLSTEPQGGTRVVRTSTIYHGTDPAT